MNPPKLPAGIFRRLAPHRRQLWRLIAAIKRNPSNSGLWREAQAVNARLLEIERNFWEGRAA